MSPSTDVGHVIGCITMFAGILTLALPITVIGANFAKEYEAMEEKKIAMRHQQDMIAQQGEKLLRIIASRDVAAVQPQDAFLHWKWKSQSARTVQAEQGPKGGYFSIQSDGKPTGTAVELAELRAEVKEMRTELA